MTPGQRKYMIGAFLVVVSITAILLMPNLIGKSADPPITFQGHTNKAVVVLGVSSMTERIDAQLQLSTSTISFTEIVSQIPTDPTYNGMILIDGEWIGKQSQEAISQVADAMRSAISNGTPVVILMGDNSILHEAAGRLKVSYGASSTSGEGSKASYGLFIDPVTNVTYPFQVGFARDRAMDYVVAESTALSYYWCEEKIDGSRSFSMKR